MADVTDYFRTQAFGGPDDEHLNIPSKDGMLTYLVYQQHSDGGGYLFQRFKHFADNGTRLTSETNPNQIYGSGGSMPAPNGGWGAPRMTLDEAVAEMFKYETETAKWHSTVSDLTPYAPILDADFKLADHFSKSSGMEAIAQAAITASAPVKGMKTLKFKKDKP